MTDDALRSLEHNVATLAARQLLLSAEVDRLRTALGAIRDILADLAEPAGG